MSLFGMQSAVAALIRCPDSNRGDDLAAFLAPYELDSREREIVVSLAEHPELNKYGQEQANQRWELLTAHIFRLFRFADEEVLEELWFEHFEPQALTVPSDHRGYFDYSLAFLRFLQEDAHAQAILKAEGPACLQALLAFETAEVELRSPLGSPLPLAAESALTNPYFRVVELAYNIPAIIMHGLSRGEELATPLHAVLVRQGPRKDPRVFMITAEFAAILTGQLADQANQAALARVRDDAQVRADLQQMGLLG